MKILIVDDDKDIESLFNQFFRKEIAAKTLEFEFKFSSEDALEFLNEDKNKSDLVLILSDINMPGKNGIELLKEIKSSENSAPVFMITAFDDENNRNFSMKYGADKFLSKPIDFVALKKYIVELMKNN